MNTVSDLRRALADEVEGLQPPGSLENRVMRALRTDGTSGNRRSRQGSRERTHAGPPRSVAVGAALIAIIVIVTLVYSASALRLSRNMPSNAPKPGAVVAPPSASWAWFFTAQDAAVLHDETEPQNPSNVLAERLLITHDGGHTWSSTRMPAAVNPQLIWVDAAHIVYIGDSAIQTTADGGLSWTSTHGSSGLATHLDPASTYFLDDHEGWTLQNNSVVYRTTDSGAHWQKLATVGSDRTTPVAEFMFTNPRDGFMAGHSQDGVGRFFQTFDGGNSWRLIQLPEPASGWPDTGGTVDAPTFFGQQGFTLYRGLTAYGYVTTDGGSTWSNARPHPNYPATVRATFVSLTDGWTVDLSGVEYRTVDGGISWQALQYSLHGWILRSVAPVGGDVLWGTASAAGSGVLHAVRSTDGGVSWSLVQLPNH